MSGQSDPDRALERLLRGALTDDAPPTASCVDPERLAAWSDGALPPAERRAIETHLAGCSRCQEMAAVFAQSAPVQPAGVPFWRRSPARWLVPITAAAAATVIWMVLPADRATTTLAPSTSVARMENPASPAPERADTPEAQRQARETEARDSTAGTRARVNEQPSGPASGRDTSAPAPLAKAEPAEADAVARQMAAAPPPAATLADRAAAAPVAEQALGRVASQAVVTEIVSPDPGRRWRIRGAVVERSDTGGVSWQPVAVPAGPAPTGGASPARDVCWLVGPAGLVLRTTDGVRFEAVNIAGAGDLASIRAEDANRATATAADGRVFTTTDGGRTWR